MSEIHHDQQTINWRRRIVRGLGYFGAWMVLGGVASIGVFDHTETDVEIAATNVSMSPTFDSNLTFDNGLLPNVRYPIDLPLTLGVHMDVGNTTLPPSGTPGEDIGNLATTYGAVAAQPDGEIQKIHDILQDQCTNALFWGFGAAAMPLAAFSAIGAARRAELYADLRKCYVPLAATAIIAATISPASAPVAADIRKDTPANQWVPASSLIPKLRIYPEAGKLEINNTALTSAAKQLVVGFFESYEKSKAFYSSLEEKVIDIAPQIHQPEPGQKVALVVSDRHDNIGMDPVHRAVADVAGATVLIDAGDDTSAGQRWEEFSLRSLENAFKGYKLIAVSGNHDNTGGGFVISYWDERGAFVPNGEVQTIDGIQMYLANDNRFSDYTGAVVDGDLTYQEATDKVREQVCDDEPAALVVVHSASMGKAAVEAGCAKVAIGGHTHVQLPPEEIKVKDGQIGYTISNGTSGGAAFSFSFGSKLRRDANVTILTFSADEAGQEEAVGYQAITYTTSGEIVVGDYIPLVYDQSDIVTELLPRLREHIGAKAADS